VTGALFRGALVVLAAFGYLTESFGGLLVPAHEPIASTVVVTAVLGEPSRSVWS
jgi:hypothetical protein